MELASITLIWKTNILLHKLIALSTLIGYAPIPFAGQATVQTTTPKGQKIIDYDSLVIHNYSLEKKFFYN